MIDACISVGTKHLAELRTQMQLMLAATMRAQDALLCCSLAGRDAALLRAVSIARGYGVMTIAMTVASSKLAEAVMLPLARMTAKCWARLRSALGT